MRLLLAGKSVCLYGPTGSGKTTMSYELFRWAQSLGTGACFYVNRKILIGQTTRRFIAGGLDVGVRAADHEDEFDHKKPLQICSADTERARVVNSGLWNFHDAGLVVVDECHLMRSKVMREALDHYKARGAMIVGLTATPVGLSDWYDELVVSGTMDEYRACNALVPAKVFSPSTPDLSKIKRSITGEFVLDGKNKKIYTQAIVGDVIKDWKLRNPDAKPTMLFAPGKPESVWLTEQFQKEGVNWCHVDATDAVVDGKRRSLNRDLWSEIIDRVKRGEIKGLSSRFKCLDSNTEILTNRGWIGHDQIRDTDSVATLNAGDFSVSWEVPSEILRRPVEPGEDMFSLHSSHLDVRVTGNHDMVFKSTCNRTKSWKKAEASELYKKAGCYQIPVAGTWEAPGLGLSEHQLSFLGWFLSDGHVRGCDLNICQSTSQPCYLHNNIETALDECGFKWSQAMYDNAQGYRPFVRYTVNKRLNPGYCGLEKYINKEMPLDVYGNISRSELLHLIKSLNYGDGCKRKSPGWNMQTLEISTGNITFASNLQALCVTRGIRCNISKRRGSAMILYINPCRTVANVKGCKEPKKCKLKKTGSQVGELVWCVTTEAGTIFTRRNGKVAVTGNCREGLDIPSIGHVILATPIGSLASYIQSVGRGLRYSPETPDEIVVSDHGGNFHRHGSPNDDRPWKDWWRMSEAAVSEMHTAEIKDQKKDEPICCPVCHMERTSGITCPGCGAVAEKSKRRIIMHNGMIREVDGKLVRPRITRRELDTQEKWSRLYWGFRKKGSNQTFNQMAAYFQYTHGYQPPRDLDLMPKATVDWYCAVKDVEPWKLHNSKYDRQYQETPSYE